MKILSFRILVVLILLTQSSFSQYSKIDISTISEEKKQEVYNFVYQTYTNCSDIQKLTLKNASSYFRDKFNESNPEYTCKLQVQRYGNITNIELAEVVGKNGRKAFRYKVKRSKADWLSEIRIILDKKDKFYGISIKTYWADTYYKEEEHPKLFVVDRFLVKDSIIKQNNEFALKSFNHCEESEIFELNETNATYRSTRKGWKTYLLKECDSVKSKLGDFKNLEFNQYLTDSIALKVYRYQVDFDNLKKPSEIRIYSKQNDKYSGIFVIDVWYDEYMGLKKAREKSRNELGN